MARGDCHFEDKTLVLSTGRVCVVYNFACICVCNFFSFISPQIICTVNEIDNFFGNVNLFDAMMDIPNEMYEIKLKFISQLHMCV